MKLALRTLLSAGFLAGWLATVAPAQLYPEMYEYDVLTRSGSSVFAYAETDISVPSPSEPCSFYAMECWDQYSSSTQLDLYLDDVWQGGYWSSQYDGGTYVYYYVDLEMGVWTLAATHEVDDLWWRDIYAWEFCEPIMYDVRYPYPSLTVNLDISISGDQHVDDGGTGYFYVTAESGTPTWYEWDFGYPSGSGNDPNVYFSDPDSDSTLTDAHWYASPNEPCFADYNSSYNVTGTAGIGSTYLFKNAALIVSVPTEGGSTDAPQFTSFAWYYAYCGSNVCPVTDFHTDSPAVMIGVSYYSQFFQKAWQHEQVHVNQFVGSNGLMNDVYSATELASRVSPLSDPTQQGLYNKVWQEINAYLAWSATQMTSRHAAAEREAYGVSDSIDPQYLWQRCNRFQ